MGVGAVQPAKVDGSPVPPAFVEVVVTIVAAGREKEVVKLLAGESQTALLGDCVGVHVLWDKFDVGYVGILFDALSLLLHECACRSGDRVCARVSDRLRSHSLYTLID